VKVSRAGFLKTCGVVLLGRTANASPVLAAVGGFCAPAPAAARAPFRVEHATAAIFQPHLHNTFDVRSADGAASPLVLAQVTERPRSHDVEQFSLTFHAAAGAPRLEGTHTFHHPALGAFDLYIAPVGGRIAGPSTYEACFSRHVSAQGAACR
jgi:hypothetical protein